MVFGIGRAKASRRHYGAGGQTTRDENLAGSKPTADAKDFGWRPVGQASSLSGERVGAGYQNKLAVQTAMRGFCQKYNRDVNQNHCLPLFLKTCLKIICNPPPPFLLNMVGRSLDTQVLPSVKSLKIMNMLRRQKMVFLPEAVRPAGISCMLRHIRRFVCPRGQAGFPRQASGYV